MATNEDDLPKVTLNSFRFTNRQANSNTQSSTNPPDNAHPANQPFPDFRRPEAYERMANDRPGQELAPDATIWKLYLEEADDYDQELVKSRHGSLDMLLLFAALFSAILTAFLIESKDLLHASPADTTVALLMLVAQSQHRVELGLPPPISDTSISLPEFTPSTSALWINGMWFTSLGLSLAAALIAMLGKEWLTAFLSSRPRPAHSHALIRQSRLEGLENWWALHIIALLPSLLHASLLLFAIGLVIYLTTLEKTIAVVMAVIVGVTSMFYITTAVLGAIYDYCPYVTQVSEYLRKAVVILRKRRILVEDSTPGNVTAKDLQALLWLAENARDPAVVDCSYQALAGMQQYTGNTPVSNGDFGDTNPGPRVTLRNLAVQISQYDTMNSLLSIVVGRFERLTTHQIELASGGEASAARYARAMVGIAAYLRQFLRQADPGRASDHRPSGGLIRVQSFDAYDNVKEPSVSLPQLLTTIDNFWKINDQPLSGNTYASILTTEMELIQLVLSDLSLGQETFDIWEQNDRQTLSYSRKLTEVDALEPLGRKVSRKSTRFPPRPSRQLSYLPIGSIDKYDHAIDLLPFESGPSRDHQIAGLRRSYSRWLARVSYLLHAHSAGDTVINSYFLDELLKAMQVAASTEQLNPLDSISTHHLLGAGPKYGKYNFLIPLPNGEFRNVGSTNLVSGPLGCILEILSMNPSVKEDSLLKTRTAAMEAFSAMAPVLLQQIVGLKREDVAKALDFRNWPEKQITVTLHGMRYIIGRQMYLVCRHMAPHARLAPEYADFCTQALGVVHSYLDENEYYNESTRRLLLTDTLETLPLLEAAAADDPGLLKLSSMLSYSLILNAQLPITPDELTQCQTMIPPEAFPWLIRIVEASEDDLDLVNKLFTGMLGRMRNKGVGPSEDDIPWNKIPSIEYLYQFTHMKHGFSAFSLTLRNSEYRDPVVDTLVQFVALAAGQDSALVVHPIELHTEAVPGFLDAISAASNHLSDAIDRSETIVELSKNSIALLTVASENAESKNIIADHSACQVVRSALKSISDADISRDTVERLEKLMLDLGITFEETTASIAKVVESDAAGTTPQMDDNINGSDEENSQSESGDEETDKNNGEGESESESKSEWNEPGEEANQDSE